MRAKGIVVLVAAALATGTLAACGQAPSSDGRSEVAQGGPAFLDAGARTAKYGTDALPGVFPRTITQAMGKTTLDHKPTRVVVLDTGELDNVVALGVQPVGVAFPDGSPNMPSYVGDKGGKPADVGTTNTLNLEAIAALKPDLILGSKLRAEKQYPLLAKIAPTVFTERPGYTWKSNFRLNSAALDRTEQADKMISDYEAAARKLGQDAQARLGTLPVISMLRFMPGRIRLYATKSFIGTVLADTGLPVTESGKANDLAVEISTEQIGKADADWILYGTYGDPGKTDQSGVLGGPLWSTLGAVKAGHAKAVPDETWYLGLGVLAANSVLTDLRGILRV
ncbi:ABC transporter substrate-binding protein [Kutzneria kofuensis]|uniref:Iron complex transport system substrate-binding protein n=1 Tax=Kutzneria kofuensis TaxID=103725 RepID=A0A7W9KJU2_9PSEU|nr:iron-siderophore ABC transporter substrate-binding protein [Kutzneria kofuensis]MBB5893879.1 iron complex transport system substrate-binding protein [Kutzneria kofuensis]